MKLREFLGNITFKQFELVSEQVVNENVFSALLGADQVLSRDRVFLVSVVSIFSHVCLEFKHLFYVNSNFFSINELIGLDELGMGVLEVEQRLTLCQKVNKFSDVIGL